MADLEHILQHLHDSEINAGVQTFLRHRHEGLERRRGQRHQDGNDDQSDGHFAAPLKWPEGVTTASWLHELALRLYPDSKYAKERAG